MFEWRIVRLKASPAALIGYVNAPNQEQAIAKAIYTMAVNKPVGDNARNGAVRKRTQRKNALMGKTAWTKRSKESGRFMDVKKGKKKFKGGAFS
jgi:hypothetical protein